MILFMRTDAAFDYMLDHRLFDIKDDGIIYPIGFKWTFFEVLFHSFAFTPGAFCCLHLIPWKSNKPAGKQLVSSIKRIIDFLWTL